MHYNDNKHRFLILEQVEFDVEMTCENCVDKVKKALAGVNGMCFRSFLQYIF